MEAKFSNVFVITSHIDFYLHFGKRRETIFKIRYWQPFVSWTSDQIEYNLTGTPEEPLLCSRLCTYRGHLYSSVQTLFWKEQGQFLSSPDVINNKLYVLHHAFWCNFCHYPTKWLYLGKSGCIRAKDVVIGQSGCIRAKVVVLLNRIQLLVRTGTS